MRSRSGAGAGGRICGEGVATLGGRREDFEAGCFERAAIGHGAVGVSETLDTAETAQVLEMGNGLSHGETAGVEPAPAGGMQALGQHVGIGAVGRFGEMASDVGGLAGVDAAQLAGA